MIFGNASGLRDSLSQTYRELMAQLVNLVPQLLGALLLLVAGWLVAYVVKMAAWRLIGGLDSILHRLIKVDGTKQAEMRRSYAAIVSRTLFWAVMLFFVAAAANLLGWGVFSGWMDSLVAYLPRLVTGLLLVLAGLLLGGAARAVVAKTAHSAGVEQGDLFGRVAQALVVVTMVVIGVEQAGLDVRFLTDLLVAFAGVFLAGGALAFGLGAKSMVANVIGAQYARKHCRVGERMEIGAAEGVIVEISQTAIILETGTGRMVVPGRLFNDEVSDFSSGEGKAGGLEKPGAEGTGRG